MNLLMNTPGNLPIEVGSRFATELVRALVDPALTVTAVRPMHGGSINHVLELTTDGEPDAIVAKLNDTEHGEGFALELASLEYFQRHTALPVPGALGLVRGPRWPISGILLERRPGVTLSDARLSAAGKQRVQHQLAEHVGELHTHKRYSFGSAMSEPGHDNWLAGFGPRLASEFEQVREQLPSVTRRVVDHVIADLSRYLPERPKPTLIHGDLWANNILIDDAKPDQPVITAFIDGFASYAHREYELAYLEVFHTAGRAFFDAYERRHPLESGYDRRRLIYWLHTMLLHVRIFGEKYVGPCNDVAAKIAR